MMLTEVCQYLRNWFNRKPDGTLYPVYEGEFVIRDGRLLADLNDGQYFRVMGSLYNDGVRQQGSLTDETFTGAVWSMSIPPEIVTLAAEIADWQGKFGTVDNLSPYQSESFGGYSYSKGGGGSADGTDPGTWQGAFAKRLNPWRKV